MKNHIEFCKNQTNLMLKPRIYVACLASYNNGYLHGEWIDANQDVGDVYSHIKIILQNSPIAAAEEFAIHDYDDFGNICIDEYARLETVTAIANFIVEYNDLGAAVLVHTGGDIDEARHLLDECYHGEYDSE